MERIIGIALTRFLDGYVKDFSSAKFSNWALNNLEFKEDVVQQLVGIPPNFEIKKASCNQIYCQIPWSKLGREPIVFIADTVYVELEEPEELKAAPPKPPPKKVQNTGKKQQGFTERILDNIKFEIKELKLQVQLLGKDYRLKRSPDKAPVANVHIKGITVKSTNDKWEVVDLLEVYKMTRKGEVLIYKEIQLDSLKLSLQAKSAKDPVVLIDNLPIRVRVKTKKAFFGGPVLFFQAYFAILNELKLALHHAQFKQIQDFVDAVMECLYRRPEPSPGSIPALPTPTDATPTSTTAIAKEEKVPDPAILGSTPPPTSSSMWSRFTNIIGSYSWGTAASSTPAPEPEPEPEPTPEPEEPAADDKEAAQSSEYVPDEGTGTFVSEEEDLRHTSYNMELAKGSVEMWEYLQDTAKGLARLNFEGMRCEFIPQIEREILLEDSTPPADPPKPPAKQKLMQSEVYIQIRSYTLAQLNSASDRHPDHIKLVEYSPPQSDQPEEASNSAVVAPAKPKETVMMNLNFINRQPPKTPDNRQPPKQRQLDIEFNAVKIEFDLAVWEGIYLFFFGGAKGRRFEQFMEQNLELVLEAALSDFFRFTISIKSPTIVLPPYAGKFLGKPYLASHVLKMHTGALILRSVAPSTLPPRNFQNGMFAQPTSQFPSRTEDFDPQSEAVLPFSQQKFQVEVSDFYVEVHSTPESPAERVLQPITLFTHIERREFMKAVKSTPHLEVFARINQIDFRLNQTQYQYFVGVYGERLAWDPRHRSEEKRALANPAQPAAIATPGPVPNPPLDAPPPMLSAVNLQIEKAQIKLLERVALQGQASSNDLASLASPNSSFSSLPEYTGPDSPLLATSAKYTYAILAELQFNMMQVRLESHPLKAITKVSANTFSVRCPLDVTTPFPDLLSPLALDRPSGKPALLVRYEKLKDTKPAVLTPPMAWVELNEVQVNWIYYNLARLLLFFSGNEIQPEFREETVKKFLSEYSFNKQEPLGMNWTLTMLNSEIVVVESPSSPECAPMQVLQGSLSRKGVTKEDIIYELEGEASFWTKLWQNDHFERDSLTRPFLLRVTYQYQRNKASDQWSTSLDVHIQDLDVSVNRRQLIMMQNTLDNQLTDIRDVSQQNATKASEEEKKLQRRQKRSGRSASASSERAEKSAAVAPPVRPGSPGPQTPAIAALAEVLQSKLSISIKKMKISLKQNNQAFASVNLSKFLYSTESWSHKWIMLIEATYLSIVAIRDQTDMPEYATIIQPRTDVEASLAKAFPEVQSRADTPAKRRKMSTGRPKRAGSEPRANSPPNDAAELAAAEPKLLHVKLERRNPEHVQIQSQAPPAGAGVGLDGDPRPERADFGSKWEINIAPLRIVYRPDVFAKFQEFFALMEEHKNLRRQYQTLQGNISKSLREQTWLKNRNPQSGSNPTSSASSPHSSSSRAQSDSDLPPTNPRAVGTIINLSLQMPLILLPEKVNDNITSLMEIQAEQLSVKKDDDDTVFTYDDYSRTDVRLHQLRMAFRTVETSKDGVASTIQHQEVISPVNIQLMMQTKLKSSTSVPYMHISCDVDMFGARISLKKYQAMMAIANKYATQFFSSISKPNVSTEEAGVELQPYEQDAPVRPAEPPEVETYVDKVFEVSVHHLNLSIVSDYQAELELFYLHFTDLDVFMGLYEFQTEFTTNCRLDALVNDLNFMIPERFIDEFNLSIRAKLDKGKKDVDESASASTFEVIILDQLQVHLTKELMRHLMEIVSLYRAENEAADDKSRSDMHSHFQFVLVNKTEVDITYNQSKTLDVKVLAPNSDSVFSFSNPYLPKVLEIQLQGWDKADDTIDISQKGWRCVSMKRPAEDEAPAVGDLLGGTIDVQAPILSQPPARKRHLQHDVLVHIKPKGLKRYIEFLSTHYVTNDSDQPIQILAFMRGANRATMVANEEGGHQAEKYNIAPGQRMPISFHRSWNMEFAVGVGDNWTNSRRFAVTRREATLKVELSRINKPTSKKFLIVEYTRSPIPDLEGIAIVNLTVTAPYVMQNITPYTLSFEFPQLRNSASSIPPNSTRAFYFDTEQVKNVTMLLENFDVWPRPISIDKVGEHQVENKKHSSRLVEGEKALVNLYVLTVPRVNAKSARTMTISLPYLLVNDTDFMLFVKQKNSSAMTYLPPRKMHPFSWQKFASKQLIINVGNTTWSEPVSVNEDACTKLVISPPGMKRAYNLLVEVKNLDDLTRIVVWRSWIHLRNHTSRDLYVNLNYEDTASGVAATASWLSLPKLSSGTSALCPDIIGISLGQAHQLSDFPVVPLPINKEGGFNLRLENRQRGRGAESKSDEGFAVDVNVNQDDKGLYITFEENIDPPYILFNNTPFPLKVRRIDPELADTDSLGQFHAVGPDDQPIILEDGAAIQKPQEDAAGTSFAALLDKAGLFDRNVLTVPPHGQLKYYTMGVHKEEESSVDFQVSAYVSDAEGAVLSPRADSPRTPPASNGASAATAAPHRDSNTKEEPLIALDGSDSSDEDLRTAHDLSDEEDPDFASAPNSFSPSTFIPLEGGDDIVEDDEDNQELTRYSERSRLLSGSSDLPPNSKRKSSASIRSSASSTSQDYHTPAATMGRMNGTTARKPAPKIPSLGPGLSSIRGGVFEERSNPKLLQFKQYFSDEREVWSETFGIDSSSNDFVVKFKTSKSDARESSSRSSSTRQPRMVDTLHISVRPQQGLKTKIITFSLPQLKKDGDDNTILPVIDRLIHFMLFVPHINITLSDSESKKELLWAGIKQLQVEYSSFSSNQNFVYSVIKDIEVDNMSKTAEYPVLFSVDKKRLHSFEPYLVEMLLEWSIRSDDGRTFIDFSGFRVLPLIVQIDGKVIDRFYEFSAYLNPKEEAGSSGISRLLDNGSTDQAIRKGVERVNRELTSIQKRMAAAEAQKANGAANDENPDDEAYKITPAQGNEMYLDIIHIYPLLIRFSIGNNKHRWPVMLVPFPPVLLRYANRSANHSSEANLKLKSFRRVQIVATNGSKTLLDLIGSSFVSQGWAEFYKIIGNLDVIGSPLTLARKIGQGFRDFFVLPLESLVLDDTPGAFVVGAVQGTGSLLLNVTDVFLTILTKSFSSLSWIVGVLTVDGSYAALKVKINRQHPSNFVTGIGQGVREFARGLWLGFSGVVLKPIEGGQREGFKGVAKGIGQGLLGLPLKPVAGVLDMFSKTFEGMLNTIEGTNSSGGGKTVLQRTHAPLRFYELEFYRSRIEVWIASKDQKVLWIDSARFVRKGRPLERYLVLTNFAIYIINPVKLDQFEYEYSPKNLPVALLGQVIIPATPETLVTVVLPPGHEKYNERFFKFVIPDRRSFIVKLRDLNPRLTGLPQFEPASDL